ncbi:MAG: dihydroorotate dehydrogenase electron transfer subunit [candidate division Zixibacteria bacterium]|nr:dihydroorotate dehydrogenase electron transfer subunit [candidate division Zixibacteria bacterium]NIR65933.1 dihydroorotate dehydrogenase electron transfer subunit [candidate division Zixibacteria bacterium]NIS16627.1 dihydroorotate dehydrogenase electron transfer subunit [candidate division Zixibacteria bacterium]NIS47577.1 dihydroorotate dehydrogenase electron transfer subunit [candidate division Zixibacteria bacterium]NIT52997.1 dihydroorotate dehydrogenase electron transfer subunit [cand
MAVLQNKGGAAARDQGTTMIFNPGVRVVEKKQLLPDLFHLKFEGASLASRALPANFVQIKVSRGLDPIFRRPMSIHYAEGKTFEMVFRTVGKGTNILSQAEIDEEFDCLGPLGNSFKLPENGELAVMVAGGVGFPPLYFFSRHLIEKQQFPKENILFLFGMKTIAEKPMADDLLRLDIPLEISTDDGSFGFHGFVTDLFEARFAKKLRHEKIRIYSCGPNAMMKRLSQIAISFRLPCQLSLEGAMPCGVGTCLGCAVKMRGNNDYYRVCQDGPVFDADEVEL